MLRLAAILFFVFSATTLQAADNILIIGDSISLGWQFPARSRFNANFIHAFTGTTLNNQSTSISLRRNPGEDQLRIENYIAQAEDWDAIIFNAGIHDMRSDALHATTIQEYEDNLNQIYDVLDRTGAPIYWATTTPIPELHPTLDFNDHGLYRSAGLRVASTRADFVIDLYAVVIDDLPSLQLAPNNVHFNGTGNQILGGEVARVLSNTGVPFSVGDVNRDKTFNFLDIAPFLAVLSTGEFQVEADFDGSGSVNFLDIIPFIGLLNST